MFGQGNSSGSGRSWAELSKKECRDQDDGAASIAFCRAGLAWLAPSDGVTIGRTVEVSASLRHGVCVFAPINHATL